MTSKKNFCGFNILANQLNETDYKIISTIIDQIGSGKKKKSISQVASENYVSSAYIVRMCKRLGYDGYSEFVYSLTSMSQHEPQEDSFCDLKKLVNNYSAATETLFLMALHQYAQQGIYIIGEGFADMVSNYFMQRLSLCGFRAFSHLHLYDLAAFNNNESIIWKSNLDAALIIAISQSGETNTIIQNVLAAKRRGFKVAAFTRNEASSLVNLADMSFVIDASRQTLVSPLPNHFFGKVILAFETMIADYFNLISTEETETSGE